MRITLLILLSVFFLVGGCISDQKNNTGQVNRTLAQDVGSKYLESKGYKVISYEDEVIENYELTKEKLMQLPFSIHWGLQPTDPEQFLGKNVSVHMFVVKNHPLDNWQSHSRDPKNIVKSKGRTNVWVYIVDGKAVGGHSLPDVGQIMYGGYWSIDGKTLEEVHSISYTEWGKKWAERFGK